MLSTKSTKTVAGLDIEAGSIAAAEASVNGSVAVGKFGVVPLGAGVFREGEVTDPEGLERAAKAYAAIFPINTMPTPEGVKTLLDDTAPRDPRAKAADPRRYVDMSFVQELESSGYLKQLYKR